MHSHQLPQKKLSPDVAEVVLLFEVGSYLNILCLFENNLTIIKKGSRGEWFIHKH